MSENYQLKTQLSATGKKIYYKAVASHIIADPDKGDASDNWLTDKWGNFNSTLTEVIGVYDTYAGLPATTSLSIGDYALVTEGHKLIRVQDDGGTKVWTPNANAESVGANRLFVNKGDDNKLYRWDGLSFAAVAGGGSNSAGAPVIFANRIQESPSNVTPGRAKSIIGQAATVNPRIIYSVYDNSTQQWVWDTSHAVDVATIYGAAWQSALYIETETGKMWTVSTSDSHLAPVTYGTYTKLIVITETYAASGWEYAITGSDSAVDPVQNGRCLVMNTTTSGGVTVPAPFWVYAVSDGQGGYTWDTQNTVSASDDLSSSNIYYATATGKLYMYVDGNATLTCIARPGTGGGSSNVEFENVSGLSNTTYPNPVEW